MFALNFRTGLPGCQPETVSRGLGSANLTNFAKKGVTPGGILPLAGGDHHRFNLLS
jgi:hypothetical protein